MRDAKRLAAIRKLPCVRCGYPHSQAAHSNFSEHGKGKGLKQMINTQYLCAIPAINGLTSIEGWDL